MNFYIFIIPFIVAIITQILKFAIAVLQQKNNFKELWAYGGMPSSHTAICFSLMTIIYLEHGISSYLLITTVFTFLVVRDAIGFRQEISKHSKVLNKLTDSKNKIILNTRMGHTPWQITVGAVIGIFLTYFFYSFI